MLQIFNILPLDVDKSGYSLTIYIYVNMFEGTTFRDIYNLVLGT